MDLVEGIMKATDGIFIQVFDMKRNIWLTLCPVTTVLTNDMAVLYKDSHQEALSEYLRKREILYILSSLQSRKVESDDECCFVLRDISMHLRFPWSCQPKSTIEEPRMDQ